MIKTQAYFLSASLMVFFIVLFSATAFGVVPKDCKVEACSQPTIKDTNLKAELITTGLNAPSNMAFLDKDILYLERYSGKVRAIINDTILPEPLLDVSVAGRGERGIPWIWNAHNSDGKPGPSYMEQSTKYFK